MLLYLNKLFDHNYPRFSIMAYIAYNNLAYKAGHKKQVKNYILKVTFFIVYTYYHLIYYKVKHFLS